MKTLRLCLELDKKMHNRALVFIAILSPSVVTFRDLGYRVDADSNEGKVTLVIGLHGRETTSCIAGPDRRGWGLSDGHSIKLFRGPLKRLDRVIVQVHVGVREVRPAMKCLHR
jgi:hypothetical protein